MASDPLRLSWEGVDDYARLLAEHLKIVGVDGMIVILEGGFIVGKLIQKYYDIPMAYFRLSRYDKRNVGHELVDRTKQIYCYYQISECKKIVIVDDIIDKGITMSYTLKSAKRILKERLAGYAVLVYRLSIIAERKLPTFVYDMDQRHGLLIDSNQWIVFPWE